MKDLLADLDHGSAKTNWLPIGAAALLLVVGVVAAFQLLDIGDAKAALCAGGPSHLEGAWDDARKVEVREALLATNKAYAQASWNTLEHELDEYLRIDHRAGALRGADAAVPLGQVRPHQK